MKLLFSLAVVTKENQKVEDLIKPYIRKNYNDNLELCIKKKLNWEIQSFVDMLMKKINM